MSEFITGEKIQRSCDVFFGTSIDDFNFNPNLGAREKWKLIKDITYEWDNPETIFCYPHRLREFRTIIHFFKSKFTLVTHNSDANITSEYRDILENPKLVCWKAQNVMFDHEKLLFLPIGIANSMWPHGNLNILQEVVDLKIDKTSNVYFQFNVSTAPGERNRCKHELERKGLRFDNSILNFRDYLMKLAMYKYAICPPGNGIDSHRIWECVYLGVIPIVIRSVFTEKLSKYTSVIVLNQWNDFNINSNEVFCKDNC
jgi:hypothetical protein